ncbi:hypothetical protein GGF46_000041 [Coemansia sp. RSA 552]|nr:hypothetical protein GGF46_000041 [Coemansia sp. RSA 552]
MAEEANEAQELPIEEGFPSEHPGQTGPSTIPKSVLLSAASAGLHTPKSAPRPPSDTTATSSSSPTKIMGSRTQVGNSSWGRTMRSKATLVDKSAAIFDIMALNNIEVIAGLYPRRMGKTLFLDMAANFLGAYGNLSRVKREESFKKCAIYDKHPEFFEENFAKYAVFALDFRAQSPTTIVGAMRLLAASIVKATDPYICLLRDLEAGRMSEDSPANIDPSKVEEYLPEIKWVLGRIDLFGSSTELTGSHARHINSVLPDLMAILDDLCGWRSVVLVDEYDAPFMSALRKQGLQAAEVADIRDVYTNFLSHCLKNNRNLRKGIQAGVFDVRSFGLGSGFNIAVTYMAHTGIANEGNPFENAFGFTVQDVWSLIGTFINTQWRRREECTDVAAFKKDLLVGCLRQFGGYRIGKVQHIFSPWTIMQFLDMIRNKLPGEVTYSGHDFWASTGSTRELDGICASSLDDLTCYCKYLVTTFGQRCGHLQITGTATTLEMSGPLSDELVEEACNQEQPSLPFDVNAGTGAKLAEICMGRTDTFGRDLQGLSNGKLSTRAVMSLLYQAGYLAPISGDEVGIPNEEASCALEEYYNRVAEALRYTPKTV